MVRQYEDEHLVFDANVANIPILADPEKVEKTTIGYFNVPSDADGVVSSQLARYAIRQIQGINEWQMYGSLEVQTVRLFLGLKSDKLVVQYDQTGVTRVDFGDVLKLKTDFAGRCQINYHGPRRTYLTLLSRTYRNASSFPARSRTR